MRKRKTLIENGCNLCQLEYLIMVFVQLSRNRTNKLFLSNRNHLITITQYLKKINRLHVNKAPAFLYLKTYYYQIAYIQKGRR